MRPLKRLALFAAALVVGLVILVFAVINLMDFNQFKPRITAAVEKATGRALAIDGDISVSALPSPQVRIEDIRLANADWSSAPSMVALKKVEVELSLFDLPFGRIYIRNLVVDRPVVSLETDGEGRGNGVLRRPETKPPEEGRAPGTPPDIVFSTIRIERGMLSFRNGETGRRDTVALDHLIALMDSVASPIGLYGSVRLNGVPLSLNGSLGNLPTLLGNRSFPVDLGLAASGAAVSIVGTVARPLKAEGILLTVSVEGDRVSDFGQIARALTGKAVPVPTLGPYHVKVNATGSGKEIRFPDVVANIGRKDAILVSLDGSVDDVIKGDGVALGLGVEVRSLEAMAPLSPNGVPVVAPLTLSTTVTGADGVYALENLKASIGQSRIEGTLTARPKQQPVRVEARLKAPFLDIVDLIPRKPGSGDKPEGAAEAGSAPTETADAAQAPADGTPRRLFPDDPLPLDVLRKVDAVIDLQAEKIVARELVVGDAAFTAFLRRGVFHVTNASGRLAGGDLHASFTLDGRRGDTAGV